MKKKLFTLSITLFIISMLIICFMYGGCTLYENDSIQSRGVTMKKINNPSMQKLLQFAENAFTDKEPIIIYSQNPVTTDVEVTDEEMEMDTKSNNISVKKVVRRKEKYFVNSISVIKPDKSIESESYWTQSYNKEDFIACLNEKITEVKEWQANTDMDSMTKQFDGGDAVDFYTYRWLMKKKFKIDAVDDDNDNWTVEGSYHCDIRCSKIDHYNNKRVWGTEYIINTRIDHGDFKKSYSTWTGPWVSERFLKELSGDEELVRWIPTEETRTGSYSIGVDVKVSPSGPTLGFGYSATYSNPDVNFDVDTSTYECKTAVNEKFRGPDYAWYPVSITPPCEASYGSYYSNRAAIWRTGVRDRFDLKTTGRIKVCYDYGFHLYSLIFLRFTRSTYSIGFNTSLVYDSPTPPEPTPVQKIWPVYYVYRNSYFAVGGSGQFETTKSVMATLNGNPVTISTSANSTVNHPYGYVKYKFSHWTVTGGNVSFTDGPNGYKQATTKVKLLSTGAASLKPIYTVVESYP